MYDMVEKIDGLLRESRLDEAYEYMKAELSAADERGDVPAVMYLLAELAGFCRDTGRMQESIGYAERAEREFPADRDSSEYTAVLLNLANAYRAGRDKRAYEVYARIDELTRRWPEHRAPYHNNYALLLQDDGRFAEAAEELRAALPLVEDDQRRTAITKANLSVCLLREGDTDGAETIARESLRWFEGQLPSDFHSSAALAAMGDICAAKGDKDKASWYYEAALSEIELHMGRCGSWDIVDEKLRDIYGGSRPHISGLELSRRYFDTFFRPAIKGLTEMCPSLADKVTIGLVGEGSECFGFDDETSFDHDMGPSFCIFADDDVPDEDYKKLVWAYGMLPRTYYGMSYTAGEHADGRRGVMRTSDLFRRIIGDIPHTAAEFQRVPDENIACAVNGAVFWGSGRFTEIRRILRDRPDADRYAKLSAEVESMSKHGEYNAVRMAERGDTVAASLCAARYIESAVKALHLIRGKFAPYHKWLMRSLEGIDRDAADRIRSVAGHIDADGLSRMIDTVNALVTDRLIQAGLIEERRPLAYIAEELLSFARRVDIAEKIIAVEWDMFDKVQNVGGRADCQDDWETFSIMRKSQYYCFDEELLRSILSDFLSARDAGRNVITEKYGYMMRYTVPEEFARIEAALPPVSEFKSQLIDAIVPIQVGWMEELSERYPHLAGRARRIHTYEDTPYATSYETYLRGELSTYSDDTAALYGAFVARTAKSGGDLAEMIMTRSVHMYGYTDLSEADKSV